MPTSQLREAYAKVRKLKRAFGRKTIEDEIVGARHGSREVSDVICVRYPDLAISIVAVQRDKSSPSGRRGRSAAEAVRAG